MSEVTKRKRKVEPAADEEKPVMSTEEEPIVEPVAEAPEEEPIVPSSEVLIVVPTEEPVTAISPPSPPELKCPKCGSTEIGSFEGNYKCTQCNYQSSARYHFTSGQ